MHGCFGWKRDPGPCPVEDAPHTTCTSTDYAGSTRQVVVTTVRRPRVLDRLAPPSPVEDVAVTPAVKTFTTATYKRAVHGVKRKPR